MKDNHSILHHMKGRADLFERPRFFNIQRGLWPEWSKKLSQKV